MNLFKRKTITVDGFEGYEYESFDKFSYLLSEESIMEDDEPITQEDVIEADVPFLTFYKYENLGNITEDEISVFKKFNIL
jgi:hypothetical protein